jgi:hypothetical protein
VPATTAIAAWWHEPPRAALQTRTVPVAISPVATTEP